MSEYQYYEFQALDQPLSAEAREDMQNLSSRVFLTASSASFVYNYGDFRGIPYRVLSQYFDIMLYVTNWGTRQLMMRFPENSIKNDVMHTYQYADNLEWTTSGHYIILNIELNYENYSDWVEGEGLLSGLAQIRNDILQGDYRSLYLAWLMIMSYELEVLEDDEDLTEPSVPPNLQGLSPTLMNFINFFDIDSDLVTAAAQASPKISHPQEKLDNYLDKLSAEEQNDFLRRLLKGEPHLNITLANRLRELSDTSQADVLSSRVERRTIRQLIKVSEKIEQQRLEVERRKVEAAHLEKMEKLASQKDQLWAKIIPLVEQKRTGAYDEAVAILKDLHDLAKHQHLLPEFKKKVQDIPKQYPTLSGLKRRLRQARLL
jgi:hypothetical protein